MTRLTSGVMSSSTMYVVVSLPSETEIGMNNKTVLKDQSLLLSLVSQVSVNGPEESSARTPGRVLGV